MIPEKARHPLTIYTVIEDAEREGLLQPYTGSRIFEGTVGSTGISIATIARARCVPLVLVPCTLSPTTLPEVMMPVRQLVL